MRGVPEIARLWASGLGLQPTSDPSVESPRNTGGAHGLRGHHRLVCIPPGIGFASPDIDLLAQDLELRLGMVQPWP